MELCLSPWSALHVWRHIRSLGSACTQQILSQQRPMPRSLGFTAIPQELINLKGTYGIADIDALVCADAKRHRRLGVRIHTTSATKAAQTAFEVEPGLFVVTPEHLFMQLSSSLSLLGLIALGCELCSIYTLSPTGDLIESVPLTTVSQLAGTLDLAACKSRAQQALRNILERSFSPRETEAALKLTLPSKLGGFAQRGLVLNSEVKLSEKGQSLCGSKFCYPDMLFPASKLVFEYDGRVYHQGQEQKDERRRLALANEGYRIERITYEQLANRTEMMRLANIASLANTGRPLRIRSSNWEAASSQLYFLLKQGVHVSNSPAWMR